MDPSALKWHDWAKDEAQLHGKKGDPMRSPPRSISSSTSTLISPNPQHQDPSSSSTSSSLDRIMCGKPTKEELKEMMPDPVNCFCNEQAHLLDLDEVGPVLVCHRWSSPQDPVMCGFHMHQDGWLQFRQELEAGLPLSVGFSGLKTCRHFNFSFCAYFFVCNSFPKLLDNGPNCFCNKPLVEHHWKTPTGCIDLQLRCEKMFSTQLRCNFLISARNVQFLKSSCHPPQANVTKREWVEDQQQSKSHVQDLLFTLLSKNDGYQQKSDCCYWEEDKLDTYSSGDSSLSPKSQTPTTVSPTLSHRSLLQNINYQNTNGVVFRKKSNGSTAAETNESPPQFMSQPLDLYELQQQELARTTEEEEPYLNEDQWASEKQQLRVELDRLQQEIDIQNRDTEYVASMINDEKLQQDYEKYQNENNQYRYSIEQCDQQRVTNQCKLAQLELQLASRKKQEDEDQCDRARPKGEDFKCKLCFNRYIEYALIPCYHLAYCETCANRLKECAICRKPVTTLIKINMC